MKTKERAKFEEWFAVYGNPEVCKEAQWHGFFGRAVMASKRQNDPSQEKSYRVTFLDIHGEQTYRYEMATSPKEAMAKVAAPNRNHPLYAKRDERKASINPV
jgi:hypothetical protein